MAKKKPDVAGKEGYIEVSSTVLGQTDEKSRRIQIRPFVTDTATVSVKAGVTVNMGDYSSARIDVMLSMPCYVEEIPAVYKQVKQVVEKLVGSEMSKLEKGRA